MKNKKGTYPCSQTLLYRLCAAAWVACGNYLSNFTAYKAIYTPAFIQDKLKQVDDAKNLPGARQGVSDRSSARVDLMDATLPVKRMWQNLKTYILTAFPKNMQHSKLQGAGMSLYRKASIENWDSVTGLIAATNSFIENNLDALLGKNGDNMPSAFPAEFAAAGQNCLDLSVIFFTLDNDKTIAVGEKNEANMKIFQDTSEMLRDGQQIFKDNPLVKNLFVFARQKDVSTGKGFANISGYIRNMDKLPLQGIMISCSELGYQTFTDEKGYYSIKKMQEGTYTITASAPGYTVANITVTLEAGKRTTAGFTLSSVLKKVA